MARSPAPPAPTALSTSADHPVQGRSLAANLLISLRPSQWTKNLIVFAGLAGSGRLFEAASAARATGAFLVFCVLSGVIYLVNDVHDREADRVHPVKSRRPVASGALPPTTAITTAAVLGAAALAAAFALSPGFGLVALSYLTLLTLYSLWLKHMVILDVLTIAAGFVLRAFGGAVVIAVPFSNWLLLLTLLLALFLGLSKRRAELVKLAEGASSHRRSLAEYSPYLLDQMIAVVTASTLLAYAFYTISPETTLKFQTDHLLYTVPFPLYGILRYLYLVHQREGGGNPSEALLSDRPLLVCVALWVVTVILVLYGPLH